MRRVVHLTTAHPVLDTRIFHREIKTLAQAGYDVTLVAQHSGDTAVEGISVIGLPRAATRLGRIFGLPWRALYVVMRCRPDICHFHDPELLPMALMLKLLTGTRVVYDVHEDLPRQVLTKYWIPRWMRKPISVGAQMIESVATKLLDAVIAATPYIARRFPSEITALVQNFPAISEFATAEPVPYRDRPPHVVYVGVISSIRGIFEMVRAMEFVPSRHQAKLLIAGQFSPPSLEDQVRKLRGWERVEFLGWRSRQDVAITLAQARIGLVVLHPAPQYIQSQPTKLFEYMASGIPVIASDFPLWREIVQDAGCGLLVNPLDPEGIARAIIWLLDHPQEAEEMGRRGQRAVLTKYNWETEAGRLLELYRRLA